MVLNENVDALSVSIECPDNQFKLLLDPAFLFIAPFSGILSFLYKEGQWGESLQLSGGDIRSRIRRCNSCLDRDMVNGSIGWENSCYCGGAASNQYHLPLVSGELGVENPNGRSPSRRNSDCLSMLRPGGPRPKDRAG
jgi:hypothetical protein